MIFTYVLHCRKRFLTDCFTETFEEAVVRDTDVRDSRQFLWNVAVLLENDGENARDIPVLHPLEGDVQFVLAELAADE